MRTVIADSVADRRQLRKCDASLFDCSEPTAVYVVA